MAWHVTRENEGPRMLRRNVERSLLEDITTEITCPQCKLLGNHVSEMSYRGPRIENSVIMDFVFKTLRLISAIQELGELGVQMQTGGGAQVRWQAELRGPGRRHNLKHAFNNNRGHEHQGVPVRNWRFSEITRDFIYKIESDFL